MKNEKATIAITHVEDIDEPTQIRQAVSKVMDLMNGNLQIPPNARVLIKVNLCLLLGPETGATVDPELVRMFVEWLIEKHDVKEVILAESDATALRADLAFEMLGWNRVFADVPRTRLLNLSTDEVVTVDLGGMCFDKVEMARSQMEADYLISFAKLKTHAQQRITGVMKNQFGSLPEKLKVHYHPKLAEAICDMTRVRPPDLCLVDGLIGHEGAGPVHGVPRVMGLLVAGSDAVATDRVLAQLMGFNPNKVPHLKLASKVGLGASSYSVLGCQVEDVKEDFAFIPGWRLAWETIRSKMR